MKLIETTHLKTWAGTKQAESRLPYYIKALINAVVHPDKLRMPANDAVWLPGYDGVLQTDEAHQFVPNGESVWEIGTTADFKGKADDDYKKRSKEEVGNSDKQKMDRSRTTFVFVTPLVWKDKEDWSKGRNDEHIWKDVVVIDGVDLVDWLEMAPAVNLSLAAELGRAPEEGLQTLEQAWEQWSDLTNPPANEDIVLAGREKEEGNLITQIVAPPSTFVVRGASPREAWGFVLAVFRRVNAQNDRDALAARTIVADNEQVAARIRHLSNHIIVLKQVREQVPGSFSKSGCHIIIPEGNDSYTQRNVIELCRPSRSQFVAALERMGLSTADANRFAISSGLSVTVLQRRMAHANVVRPTWCNEHVSDLLPAVLAGRWNSQNDKDKEIVRILAGSPDYATVEAKLQRFRTMDDPPIQKVDNLWTLTAPVDAFEMTARHLSSADLQKFSGAFREVFGQVDPKVELPPDEWIAANRNGQQQHSGWLRAGMAETAILIAERGVRVGLDSTPPPQEFVDRMLLGLPGLDDWRILASIRDQYPRLLEAAPRPLLESLEHMLEAKPHDVQKLFTEGDSIFGGGAMHTGLLWGLEALAWSPDYLPRVATILATLARLDPGGQIVNRPINTLREIFLWWHPGTNANVQQRLAAIDLVLAKNEDIGWNLIGKLLPDMPSSIAHGTNTPRWRDFGDMPSESTTRRGQINYLSAIIDRTLDFAGESPQRWSVVLDSLGWFSTHQMQKVLDLLGAIAEDTKPQSLRLAFWEILRDFIYKHRTYNKADWAVSEERLDQMETLLPQLVPSDLVVKNRWLFDDWLPDIPFAEEDIEERQRKTDELRLQAAQEILQTQGVVGLINLGLVAKYPGLVAAASISVAPDVNLVRTLVEQAIDSGDKGILFAGQLSGQAREKLGDSWRDMVVHLQVQKGWNASTIANLILWWPDNTGTWEDATRFGVEAEYWREKPVFLLRGPRDEQIYQINHLIEAKRAARTLGSISYHCDEVPTEALARLFDAAFDELEQMQTEEEVNQLQLNPHYIHQILNVLRTRNDLAREELVRREYRALPLLMYRDARGLMIHEFMAQDPGFFVSVLSDAFLPRHRDKSHDFKPSPEEEARGRSAFTLLRGMDKLPGRKDNGEIDEGTLADWIQSVRQLASEADRLELAEQHIGQIFAHSANDPDDDGWPHHVIRNMIENLNSEQINKGLMIERFNMRGTYSKSLFEGGTQERLLAEQYRQWAMITRPKWPRVTTLLETMALEWDQHARREDVEAEQDKLE